MAEFITGEWFEVNEPMEATDKMTDYASSPFLSHWVDEDFVQPKIVNTEIPLKCCVWNCTNSSDKGRCFEFGGLVICAPCYHFLTTGMRANSQLERNVFKLLKENVESVLDKLYVKET